MLLPFEAKRLTEIHERALHEPITTPAHIDRDFLLTLVERLLGELNAANQNQPGR